MKPGGGLYQYFPLGLNWVSSGFFFIVRSPMHYDHLSLHVHGNHHKKIPFGNVLSNTGTSQVIAVSGMVLTSLSCL